jgi:hypothetical protein
MILYLRVVHSMDYYGGNEYHNEDEMPNRCGMIHARGSPPQSRIMPDDSEYYSGTSVGDHLVMTTKFPQSRMVSPLISINWPSVT